MVLFWLPMVARGQTITDLADIDLSGLPQPTRAKALRYWFDDDAVTVQTTNQLSGSQVLDVSGLIEGLHTLHYQIIDESGLTAYVGSSIFLKISGLTGGQVSVNSLRYWFDDNQADVKTQASVGTHTLDVSTLLDGLHTIHYQVKGSDGQVYYIASSLFMKAGNSFGTELVKAQKLLFWFDDETTIQQADISEGTQVLDASRLIEGLHTVHYQIANSNGTLGTPASSVFLKMDADLASATAMSVRYWFDDDAATVTTTSVAGGTQTLDVSALPTGLHTLNYQLVDSNGRVSVPVTRLFLKNFDTVLTDGHNRVTKYQYWLNTNNQAMQTVTLDEVANPYTLVALLPMHKEPIHSDCFQFEVTNDVPTIYAKNILHIRFHDAQGYFTDGEKPFIDYSVSHEIEPVGELQATQTFPKVAENDIRWYTMQVALGDTVAFRLSQAATLQVFAPNGKEVFKTSESASVQWGGIHTWEDGTYYVAVHDVTGSQSNMTLDYMHMGKGDVNGDGQVGIADIVAITSYMAGSNASISLKDADVNGDSQVGIADIIAITDIMAGTTYAKAYNPRKYITHFVKNKKKE